MEATSEQEKQPEGEAGEKPKPVMGFTDKEETMFVIHIPINEVSVHWARGYLMQADDVLKVHYAQKKASRNAFKRDIQQASFRHGVNKILRRKR